MVMSKFLVGEAIFPFVIFLGPALFPIQPESNTIRDPGLRRLGRGIFHSPLSGGEVKITLDCYSFHYISSWPNVWV
jgi:hypothetical protein